MSFLQHFAHFRTFFDLILWSLQIHAYIHICMINYIKNIYLDAKWREMEISMLKNREFRASWHIANIYTYMPGATKNEFNEAK